MSSDPKGVLDALERAQDAFGGVGFGVPAVEEGIAEGGGWETQLTKACKLLGVVDVLHAENGYYPAVIELGFGGIERSIEAYLVRMAGHDVEDFRDHEQSYGRADQSGLFEAETAEALVELYRENRTESYYGGDGRPSRKPRRWLIWLVGFTSSWWIRFGRVECVFVSDR